MSLDNATQTRTEDFHVLGASSEFFTDQDYIYLYTNSQAITHHVIILAIWTVWGGYQSSAGPGEKTLLLNRCPIPSFVTGAIKECLSRKEIHDRSKDREIMP